ncbi:DegT/DnrJ/EryC1/StrS family aminotransferase, partial [Microbacteriaceae bacterium K1510]|nr:DegT/DnrJ/EryC1/StrS family aminotransferase [Microbacteriaceae bacterium K1510]
LDRSGLLRGPRAPDHCRHNYHTYYVLLHADKSRRDLIAFLREHGIHAVSHYVPLHLSPVGRRWGYVEGSLPVTEDIAPRLLRLPLFFALTQSEQDEV